MIWIGEKEKERKRMKTIGNKLMVDSAFIHGTKIANRFKVILHIEEK